MCAAQTDVRLYWNARISSGCAVTPGVYRRFSSDPKIKGLPAHLRLIDYVPATQTALLQEDGYERRAMQPSEVMAAQRYLSALLMAKPYLVKRHEHATR